MKVIYDPITNSFENANSECLLPQIMWHVIKRCYLDCKTCFAKGRKSGDSQLTFQQVIKNLSLLKKLGIQKIDISGGEPLLYEHLPNLVQQTIQEGVYLTITTRGIGSRENQEWLLRNWEKFTRVIVSIDGSNSEIGDYYSGVEGSFTKTIDFCKQLKECSCDNLRINTVVNRCIQGEKEQKDFLNLVSYIAPKEWCLIEPIPLNKKSTFDDFSVTSEEYEAYYHNILNYCFTKEIKVISRRRSTYGTYWALYSDNTICKLSDTETVDYSSDFSEDEMDRIVEVLTTSICMLPHKE